MNEQTQLVLPLAKAKENLRIVAGNNSIGMELLKNPGPHKVSPYGTWVSEVMLQQTRVETVIDYYNRWMTAFPTVESLSKATDAEVNSLWAGLGYYRRARMLHQGSKYIMNECQGKLPSTIEGLLKVPGIGSYTAGAISSIAFNDTSALVDGNVLRVFSRLFAIACSPKDPAFIKKSWDIANYLIEGCDSPSDFNQGLMELGATICVPKSPGCERCPMSEVCYTKNLASFYVDIQKDLNQKQFSSKDKLKPIPLLSSKEKPLKKSKKETQIIKLDFQEDENSVNDSLDRCKEEHRHIEDSQCQEITCEICQEKGINAIFNVLEALMKQDSTDITKSVVEAFPLKAEKKESKVEHLYVGLIELPIIKENCKHLSDEYSWYLMRKRPDRGLLANQWEFPWIKIPGKPNKEDLDLNKKGEKDKEGKSSTKKRKLNSSKMKENNLISELFSLLEKDVDLPKVFGTQMKNKRKKKSNSTPKESKEAAESLMLDGKSDYIQSIIEVGDLTHIFSHVKHHMKVVWIQLKPIRIKESHFNDNEMLKDLKLNWSIEEENSKAVSTWESVESKQQIGWLTYELLKKEGISTGMVKVLDAVEKIKSTE